MIIAPEISSEAETIFNKKQDVRVLETGNFSNIDTNVYELKKVSGGLLIQSTDDGKISEIDLKISAIDQKISAIETKCSHVFQ